MSTQQSTWYGPHTPTANQELWSGRRVKFDAENYGISSIEACNQIIKAWNQPGEILVYHNVVIHEDTKWGNGVVLHSMAPKETIGWKDMAIDASKHHRTCHLRHGGEECTC